MMNKLARYGEPLMWIVLISFFPVIFIYENKLLPKETIIYWGIVAGILATIGFVLNGRHIKVESAERIRKAKEMSERHDKMLGIKR